MRPRHLLFSALVAALALPSFDAAAQPRRERPGSEDDEDARRRERDRRKEEWQIPDTKLPGQVNIGPCPYVKVLYDAARWVEFEGREAAAQVKWTGEIQGVEADCVYREATDPIRVDMAVGFSLGRGPRADAATKDYRWWVAVTDRNRIVLAKEYFAVRGDFTAGGDRTDVVVELDEITIPRATATVAGSNFEILVGFDVTPQMAEFNRDGKRFRVNTAAAPAGAPPSQ